MTGRGRASGVATWGRVALAVLAYAGATRDVAAQASGGTALRVGTSGDYAPFSRRDADGRPSGFDVAMAERLARDLGRPLSFVSFQWPDLVAHLRAGAFDVAMSGVTVRADRAVTLRFTRPYAVAGAVVVVRAADATRFRRVEDVDQPNVRVAVNAGGHLERVARQHFPRATIRPLRDNLALLAALTDGAADAVVSDVCEARTWAGELVIVGPFTRDRKSYAVGPEAVELRRTIDAWLAAREADGWLNEQRRRWLGAGAVWTPQEAAIEALVSAINLRLELMPLVAAVKRRAGLPVEDAAQEARVLDRTRATAGTLGVDAEAVVAFFRVQMEAAKAVEHAADASTGAATGGDEPSLETMRAAVAAVSDQLIHELARSATLLPDPAARDRLDEALRAGLQSPAAVPYVTRMVEAIPRVKPVAPGMPSVIPARRSGSIHR